MSEYTKMHQSEVLTLENASLQERSVTRVSFHASTGYKLDVQGHLVTPGHMPQPLHNRVHLIVPADQAEVAIAETIQQAFRSGVFDVGGQLTFVVQRARAGEAA